ncbi:MAG TPA: sensor histidine kinase [Firmicutes bacterium]|nr:sensor histidine kinase [Bacillota bacterium]
MDSIGTILQSMVRTVEESKKDLFQIQEDSQIQLEKIQQNLEQLQTEIEVAIQEQDRLYVLFKQARLQLVEVSRSFQNFSEKEIEAAYNQANEIQMQLFVATENEEHLKKRRTELQEDFSRIEEMIERSAKISLKISVIIDYLTNDVWQLKDEAEESKKSRAFGIKMLESQEEERKRLSREIHDGPAQMMAHLVAKSDLIERMLLVRPKEEVGKELRELKKDVRSTLTEVRRIIYDLRPMVLDDLGIVPALRKYLKNVSEKNEIKTELRVQGHEMRLDSKLEVAIFRVVQESVNNVLKHGKNATQIIVNFSFGLKINIQIKDNGLGFDMQEKKENSFGILGMKERVSLFQGKLEIYSALNSGTTVQVIFPVEK